MIEAILECAKEQNQAKRGTDQTTKQ
jgi:hypothetical protein